jgi:hypothetical protein
VVLIGGKIVDVIGFQTVAAASFAVFAATVFGQDIPQSPDVLVQSPIKVMGLPTDAKMLEIREVPQSAHSNRALLLWMAKPEKFPRHNFIGEPDEEPEPYTCPEDTRGWHYRGPTRVSLVDTLSGKIINTAEVKMPLIGGWQDEFDIPYWIQPKFYTVAPPLRAGEGKPVIMDLKDFTGDGKALEFALFDAESCSTVVTQLIGYSQRQDRVIQYAIHLKGEWYEGRDPILLWLDSFLLQKPVRPGEWKYIRHYNSGASATFEIRYDESGECFRGTVQWQNQ